jgi:hypothetical protein
LRKIGPAEPLPDTTIGRVFPDLALTTIVVATLIDMIPSSVHRIRGGLRARGAKPRKPE